jgi:SAM-dependent methyltransferase
MRTPTNPFTDPGQVHGPLYATAGRLARRTSALHRARVSGRHAADVIAELATNAIGTTPAIVADIGCGRGTTTRLLAERLPRVKIVAVDTSAALLSIARSRRPVPQQASMIRADFHRLPFPDSSLDLIVAAFCLYHSPSPANVIKEIARCLVPGGTAIITVKSADSYRELDLLVAASGLDPAAEHRPSLYRAAHSGNIESLATTALSIVQVTHETHLFVFPTFADAAGYLTTSPKYDLPPQLIGDPAALAAALRQKIADTPTTTTSIVTYLVATRLPTASPP